MTDAASGRRFTGWGSIGASPPAGPADPQYHITTIALFGNVLATLYGADWDGDDDLKGMRAAFWAAMPRED